MEYRTILWLAVALISFYIINRLASRFLFHRIIRKSYDKDIQDLLTKEKFRVKGRFE